MEDFGEEYRPQKAEIRRKLVELAPDKIRTALLLPSAECLDLQELIAANKLTPDCKLIIAEQKEDVYKAMMSKINKLGLKKNILYSHLGNVEDIDPNLIPDLDFVNYDLCGCFGIEALKWVHDVIVPKLNGLFSITYLKSYRRKIDVSVMLDTLRTMPEIDGTISYKKFKEHFQPSYEETKNIFASGALSPDEIAYEHDLIERYITQYHYVLHMVLAKFKKTILRKSYNDTQSQMCIWFFDAQGKTWDQNFPDFNHFYDLVQNGLPEPEGYARDIKEKPEDLLAKLIELNLQQQKISLQMAEIMSKMKS